MMLAAYKIVFVFFLVLSAKKSILTWNSSFFLSRKDKKVARFSISIYLRHCIHLRLNKIIDNLLKKDLYKTFMK